jgi:alpha-beta hydrolase superfamily lysophospholipase
MLPFYSPISHCIDSSQSNSRSKLPTKDDDTQIQSSISSHPDEVPPQVASWCQFGDSCVAHPQHSGNKPMALCLLVHGGGWHSGYFDGIATHLTQHDIFFASYDQVNCGYSDPEPDTPAPGVTHVRSFDCFIEDVCAAIEWMQMEAGTTSTPVFLVGESFGALEVR